MLKNVLILFLVVLSLKGWGQNEAIQNEILNYSDSKSDMIIKGRRLLLDKFLEGDYQKVKEVKDYLKTELENEDYAALYPIEYWLILYWTQDYQELIKNMNELEAPQRANFARKIKPPYDLLFEKIRDHSLTSQLFLQTQVKHAELEQMDKDFLSMNLTFLLMDEKDELAKTQDMLNVMADEFLEAYPESKYEHFTRTYYRQKFVPSNWGFGFEFFSGYSLFTENLETRYKNQISIGVAFDVQYKRVILYLRDYIGLTKTKEDFPYDTGVWEKGSQARVYMSEASLGYVTIDNKYLKVVPFAGIASTDIAATEVDLTKKPDLDKVELEFTTTYAVGLNVDIKLGRSKMPIVSFEAEQNYLFLRLRYAYCMPQFEKNYDGVSGNMHYLTIGIGGFGRKIKREH